LRPVQIDIQQRRYEAQVLRRAQATEGKGNINCFYRGFRGDSADTALFWLYPRLFRAIRDEKQLQLPMDSEIGITKHGNIEANVHERSDR
jgi:hypothetical protein